MNEETNQAESSPATPVVEVEIDRGPLVNWTSDERAEFRRTGEMPKQSQQDEESTPSDAAKEPEAETEDEKAGKAAESKESAISETDGDPEPPKKQQESSEKIKRRNAESRKAQLSAEIQDLLKQRDGLRKEVSSAQTKPAESSPAAETKQPQTFQEWEQMFDSNVDAWWEEARSLNPDVSDARIYAEMARVKGAARDWYRQYAEVQHETARALDAAKSRYADADEKIQPALTAIVGDTQIAPTVKEMLNESEVLPDLLFTIGSSEKELSAFVHMAKTNPGKALRYIALTESLIREELDGQKQTASEPNEKETLAKPQTRAPKPPSEIGGRAATPGDEMVEAAQANDFRRFKTEANRRYLAQIKG